MDKIKLCVKETDKGGYRICMTLLEKEIFLGNRIKTKEEAINKALQMEKYSGYFTYDQE